MILAEMTTAELIQAIAVGYGVLLFSLVFHEAAHALFAKLGGDLTAYQGGQVTLNPIPHMRREPFGTILLPLFMLISSKGSMTMGYAHIPVDPVWANRHPRKAALMAAAGPLSNLLLATVAFVIAKVLLSQEMVEVLGRTPTGDLIPYPIVFPFADERNGMWEIVCSIISMTLLLNLLLATINLIPFPPLDGGSIVQGLFPDTLGRVIRQIQGQPFLMIGIMVLLFFNVMKIMEPIFRVVRSWL